MSRRLWVTTLLLVFTLAVIITLSIIAFFENAIPLFVTVLVFTALAVVAFNYMVENTKKQARNLCATGKIIDPKLHDKICDRLATAPNDTEATALHKKMKELKENHPGIG
jgi:uncharacterized membrane protein YoaK (UPF0700 family)